MKVKTGDKVKVITGKDKGKTSSIVKVYRDKNKIVVEGVNVVKRHIKPGVVSQEGGIVSVEKPIDVSNVMVICEKCNKPTTIGYKFIKDKKYRYCKKCDEVLDK